MYIFNRKTHNYFRQTSYGWLLAMLDKTGLTVAAYINEDSILVT